MILQATAGIGIGTAIILTGVLAMLLWACVTFRNPLGTVMWAVTVLMFALSVMFDFGTELVWGGIILTAILVVVGVAARANS